MGSRPEKSERELATAFLAGVSHELRTPLNAVLGMLELSLDEPLSPTVRDYLSTACESARALTTNLNLMLELAQVDGQPPRVDEHPLNLHSIVDTAIGMLADATQKRVQVRMRAVAETSLYGDASQLERVVVTLLEQSARWLENPTIVVEIDGHPLPHDLFQLEIGVSERGITSDDDRAQLELYDPAVKSEYSSPELSLAIVQRWLDRVGGKLWTDSVTSGGRFLAQIPLTRLPPHSTKSETFAASIQQRQQRFPGHEGVHVAGFESPLDVLVVDDTEANQKVVKAVLAKRGHRVELAGNGQEAIEQLRRRNFDVVLMDAQMPLMNGFEATAAIRMLPETSRSRVPIIAMTAHALQEDRMRCLAAGMDDYLPKPIDVATLVAHVEFYGHGNPNPHAPASTRTTTSDERPMPPQDFLAGARARLAGDEALLLELIRLFRQDANSLLDRIALGIHEKDSELAGRAAHSLRGLAANFDDVRTISAAGTVEKLALKEDFERATAQLERLRDECARLIDALNDYERGESQRDV